MKKQLWPDTSLPMTQSKIDRREATAKRIAEIMRAEGFTLVIKMADKTASTWFDKYRHDATGLSALVEIFADGDASEIYISLPDGNTWDGTTRELKAAIERAKITT